MRESPCGITVLRVSEHRRKDPQSWNGSGTQTIGVMSVDLAWSAKPQARGTIPPGVLRRCLRRVPQNTQDPRYRTPVLTRSSALVVDLRASGWRLSDPLGEANPGTAVQVLQ